MLKDEDELLCNPKMDLSPTSEEVKRLPTREKQASGMMGMTTADMISLFIEREKDNVSMTAIIKNLKDT